MESGGEVKGCGEGLRVAARAGERGGRGRGKRGGERRGGGENGGGESGEFGEMKRGGCLLKSILEG